MSRNIFYAIYGSFSAMFYGSVIPLEGFSLIHVQVYSADILIPFTGVEFFAFITGAVRVEVANCPIFEFDLPVLITDRSVHTPGGVNEPGCGLKHQYSVLDISVKHSLSVMTRVA